MCGCQNAKWHPLPRKWRKGEILSPQMILNPGLFIWSLYLEECSDLANVNHMSSRINEFLKDSKRLRKQEIVSTSDKYMSKHFWNKPNPKKYEIKIGDLVFIKDKNKYDDFTFRQVKSINGSDAVLTTKYGEVQHQIALLKIFAPSSVSLHKTWKNYFFLLFQNDAIVPNPSSHYTYDVNC